MKKRIAIIATAVVIVASLLVGGTFAFFTDKREINNVVTMGNVDVTLTEPRFHDSTGGTYQVDGILPGQVIAKDPTVTNVGGNDAYIRCKVTVEGLPQSSSWDKELTPEQELFRGINIDSGKWVYSDGYYYYQEKLLKPDPDGTKHSALLFDSVTIPHLWNGTLVNDDLKFTISITAEAIQSDNFKPTLTNGLITGWNYSAEAGGGPVPIKSDIKVK